MRRGRKARPFRQPPRWAKQHAPWRASPASGEAFDDSFKGVVGTCRQRLRYVFDETEKETIMTNRTLAVAAVLAALALPASALADETGLVGGAVAGAVVGGPVGAVVGGVTGNYLTNQRYHRHYYRYGYRGDRRYVR
jgi:hypothetical protein